jgi:3',5'-cyclic AMP phosphodiesterase CpdA
MDRKQLDWFERAIRDSKAEWKMAYFHHPLYSSGETHGSETDLRTLLEPLFLKYGMEVVFAGHEHFYERVKPQKGIHYFTCGGSAKLRKGNIQKGSQLTEKGDDIENTFMLVEVANDVFNFQTISRGGRHDRLWGLSPRAQAVDYEVRPQACASIFQTPSRFANV